MNRNESLSGYKCPESGFSLRKKESKKEIESKKIGEKEKRNERLVGRKNEKKATDQPRNKATKQSGNQASNQLSSHAR